MTIKLKWTLLGAERCEEFLLSQEQKSEEVMHGDARRNWV